MVRIWCTFESVNWNVSKGKNDQHHWVLGKKSDLKSKSENFCHKMNREAIINYYQEATVGVDMIPILKRHREAPDDGTD